MVGKKLTVTHVLAPARFGGLERVVHSMALMQARRGHDVHVVEVLGPSEAADSVEGAPPIDGVTLHTIRIGNRAYLKERRTIGRILHSQNADILHTHGYRPDVVDAPVGRKIGVGVVGTAHGFTRAGGKNSVFEWLQRRAYRRFDAVIAVSRPLADELVGSGVPGSKVHCVPNSMVLPSELLPRTEARAVLGIPGEDPAIGWIGRLTPEKGPEVAVQALARAHASDAQLFFIGTGCLEESLRVLAQSLGLDDRVHFLGYRPNAGRCMKAFDLVTATSFTEGTPVVLLEAMYAGIPIVSTQVGGVPFLLSDSEAVLVQSGDEEAVATGIDAVLSDPVEAEARARGAAARFREEFDPGSWVDRYIEIYEAVLS